MDKREIVTHVLHQIFDYHFDMSKSEFLAFSLQDSEDFDGDNLYGVYEDIDDAFNIDQDAFSGADDVEELVGLVCEHWKGEEVNGVDKKMKWTPPSGRYMGE